MPYQYMLDLVLLEQLVINEQDCPAGVAEYEFDPFLVQAFDQDVRPGQLNVVCGNAFHVSLGENPAYGD
jgi:hypothetical protein